jgi:TetR/AcrR family transcriptional repressor of nem operon
MTTTAPSQDTRQALLGSARSIMVRKGFSAVGLNEVLSQAGVPKGSFYHYFSSKDAFGEAMMQSYLAEYLANMDRILSEPGQTAAERLLRYFGSWREIQIADDCQAGCLVVKLGAEVADLSESMRRELNKGIESIIDRLERTIRDGAEDGSARAGAEPRAVAETLYDIWVGASVVAKINRSPAPLDTATAATRQLLHL